MFYMYVKGYAYSHTQKDTHLTLNTVEKSSPTAQGERQSVLQDIVRACAVCTVAIDC